MGGKHLTKSKTDFNRLRHHRKDLSGQDKVKNQQAINKPEANVKLQENLSFSGCGFLGIYHVGVASCFHEYAPQISMHKVSGSSAGAIVAVAHICGNLHLASFTTGILRVAIDARARVLGPLHPSFDINLLLRNALEQGLPDDVHLIVNDKLHISLTRLDNLENVIVNRFDSKEDVIQALICSCFIPCWSGFSAPKYKGVAYIDGGFSNNVLILDDKTIAVSPFAGEADICPRDNIGFLLNVSIKNTSFSLTPHNLYRLSHALMPPPLEVLSEICQQGFSDAIRFLYKMELISCVKCLEIRSSELMAKEAEYIEQTYSYQRQTRDSSYGDSTVLLQPVNTDPLNSCYADEISEALLEAADCDGCILRRTNALQDPLPKLFSDRLREACDNFNESLYNWLYSHKPIKYLSYLAAPYYMPMSVSLALITKYWQQLPQIGHEMIKYFSELKDIFIKIVKGLYERSTTSLLTSETFAKMLDDCELLDKQQSTESSILVKITADYRRSSIRSLTTYECCLTIVLFGRQTLLSTKK